MLFNERQYAELSLIIEVHFIHEHVAISIDMQRKGIPVIEVNSQYGSEFPGRPFMTAPSMHHVATTGQEKVES